MPETVALLTASGADPEPTWTPAAGSTLTVRFVPSMRGTAARCRGAGWSASGAESKTYRRSTGTPIFPLVGGAACMESRPGSFCALGLGTAEGSVGGGGSGAGDGVVSEGELSGAGTSEGAAGAGTFE